MMSRHKAPFLAFLLLAPTAAAQETLPGTTPWDDRADPPAAMVSGIARFLDRELAESVSRRPTYWKRDTSSPAAYNASVEPNRRRLREIIGAIDPRAKDIELHWDGGPDRNPRISVAGGIVTHTVRWKVFDDVWVEGLLLEPREPARANVVAVPDADVTPEQFCGLTDEAVPPEARVPLLLAQSGCRVLVPTLLDRTDEFSGSPLVRPTNLTHREWIYRMAFEAGRHVIGCEVEAVSAAIDWFTREGQPDLPLGVMGYGEGGLIALYAAALDTRIDAAWVAGYFGPREAMWREPVYRNVWGLLEQFGDAEIASLVAPRRLIIEACRGPEVPGPPPPRNGRSDAASGRLTTPDREDVQREAQRAGQLVAELQMPEAFPTVRSADIPDATLNRLDVPRRTFLEALGLDAGPTPDEGTNVVGVVSIDPRQRQRRLVKAWQDHIQSLIRTSELRRDAYWSKVDRSSPDAWSKSVEPYRERFWEDVIGRFPPATEPLQARTVKLYDEPRFVGYAVELPVWPDVVASGILLLPKDLQPGERRPVVVCQHGLEGTPVEVVDPRVDSVYHSYGAQLADRGYIVYAPQNPYKGHDTFRQLQRRAHPLKKSLFAVIVRQHERTLEWLATLPQVDPARIGFYGLSYGGKTAMRVPAILPGYCLSICSADFNEWVVKCTNTERHYSYMYTLEYDMYEFGLSEGFNYAEMAALIAPRPFQVERGHHDGVAPDEWIGYEFAKVKRTYDLLGLADRVDIAYFNGPHEIDGKATFEFLAKHLNWPRGRSAPE